MRDRKRLEALVRDDDELVRRTGDIEAYFELAREGEDVLADLEREIKALGAFSEDLEARTMLSGEADALNAIVTVHPGAGGTESQDWAEMLLRMPAKKPESSPPHSPSSANTHSASSRAKAACIASSAFLRSTPQSAATLRLPRSMFRRRSTRRFMSISSSKTCALTRIVPAAKAASTSTPLTLLFV
jgi:hypothetical protein